MRSTGTTGVEADLIALKLAAERAGTALACLFSSSGEFEAEVIRVRRQAISERADTRRRSLAGTAGVLVLLTLLFLML